MFILFVSSFNCERVVIRGARLIAAFLRNSD